MMIKRGVTRALDRSVRSRQNAELDFVNVEEAHVSDMF